MVMSGVTGITSILTAALSKTKKKNKNQTNDIYEGRAIKNVKDEDSFKQIKL